MNSGDRVINCDQRVLVTGAGGFIGRRVVACLLERGFTDITCLARPAPKPLVAGHLVDDPAKARCIEVLHGNLLSPADCLRITKEARLVLHLAAGRGEKSYAEAFLNSVVTTRNLLDACVQHGCLKRFVNISSFVVYSAGRSTWRRCLDETWPLEEHPELRGQAYCFAKVRQDQMVTEYGRTQTLPWVILRPGMVYGPGNEAIHSRIGLGPFGLFLHLGGGNKLPLTYVDNCAEAIVLAGLVKGVEGEVFNVVDDELPSSRRFLRLYKERVRRVRSVYVPRWASYLLCWAWEIYSARSQGQLPPVFNRATWRANWKKTRYSNDKLKSRLGWSQRVPTSVGLQRHFGACRQKGALA